MRTHTPRRNPRLASTLPWLVAASAVTLASAACGPEGLTFFEVSRSPTEECDILPQGEFCVTADELSPPVLEVWSVERRGDEVRVFIEDEVWVAEPADDASDVRSEKQEFTAASPGPCTTTSTRILEVVVTGDSVTGTLQEKTRLDGPESCGDMPRGARTTSRIDGALTDAP